VLLGGYLYDQVGMVSLFRILSIIAIAGLAIFWFADRSRTNESVII
jgi:predicted MFS family arabinose efflux permease